MPVFGLKHYNYLAKHVHTIADVRQRNYVTLLLAQIFGEDNPQFNQRKWENACGTFQHEEEAE